VTTSRVATIVRGPMLTEMRVSDSNPSERHTFGCRCR
jgi:hypothetical protein